MRYSIATNTTRDEVPERYQRPPRSSGPQRPTRPTVYERIMHAAAGGHALTLTPDDVATLSAQLVIQEQAAADAARRQ